MFLGAFVGIFAAVLLLSAVQDTEGDPTVIHAIGDWFSTLTTSEETRLSQLESVTQAKVRELLSRMRDQGVVIWVGQTLRTSAQEAANIEAGKTAGGLIHSWHELARAVDLYPTLPSGSPDYNATNLDNYRAMHEQAVNLGFRSLAFNSDGSKRLLTNSKGKKIWDGGHIEWRAPYDSIAQAWEAEGVQAWEAEGDPVA